MAALNEFGRLATRSTIFDRRCVSCEPTLCNCNTNETCEESSRTCDACPTVTCVPNTPTPAASSGGGTNAGAIAGGVIGGLAFIGIVTFLVWWFVIRKRRQAEAAEREKNSNNNTPSHQRSRSMQSIASTVLTRASNVIQIAYIPGVTNRSEPHTPGTLVPPVPPLPSAHTSTFSNDQYLFTPSDLRDSQYSALTNDRRSIATSLARSSIATTIYRNDAIISPIPAQQARAAKAAMVSVKSGTNTPTDAISLRTLDAPAVPAITEAQLQKASLKGAQNSSIVARSVIARPVNVKGSKPKVPTVSEEEIDTDSSESIASHSRGKRLDVQDSKFDDSSDDEDDDNDDGETTTPTGPVPHSIQISLSVPSETEGPFADQSTAGKGANATLASSPAATNTAVSTSRASIDGNTGPTHRQRTSLGSVKMLDSVIAHEATTQRSSSPFDDEHEVK